jgi:hypothetical protein
MGTMSVRFLQAATILVTLAVCALVIPLTGTLEAPAPAGVYIGFGIEALIIIGLFEWGHRSGRV